jgi:integrase/recombinase XerD
MRPVTSFGVKFNLRLARTSNDFAPLTVRITVDGQRKNVSLEHKVQISNWLPKEEKLKGNDIDTRNLNNYINEVRAKLYEAKRTLVLESKTISPESIWDKFEGKKEQGPTLNMAVKYHNDTMLNTLTWGTAKNYYTTQKYLNEYLKIKLGISDIPLSELNYKFLIDFDLFLRNHVPGENQKPCGNNTVMKHIERFRKIINMAIKYDWLKQDPFSKFEPKFIKTERGFHSADELFIIESKAIFNVSLCIVRDLYLFSCYTGLSFSDADHLKEENLSIGIDGEWWITIARQKTNVCSRIPLLPKALEIINKYRNHPKSIARGTLLPMISNQRFNSYLKEIQVICNIPRTMTHHMARHTFATTICLSHGVSMAAIMEMLGHTKMSTTQLYSKVVPQLVSSEMLTLRKKLDIEQEQRQPFSKEA